MINGINELAKMFKERENPPSLSFVLGRVSSVQPIIIQPDAIKFVLDADDLIIPKQLLHRTESVKIGGIEQSIEFEGLKPSDRVALLPSKDNQKYIVLGVV